MNNNIKKSPEIVLLYTGGLDTTLEAVGLSKLYPRVHLLTFNNGFCVNNGSAARSADILRGKLGFNIIHSFVSTQPWVRRLRPNFWKLWEKYRSPLIIDMFCKAGALAAVIEYALHNNILYYSDGSSTDQTQIFIQHPLFRRHIRPGAEEFGLRYVEPLYSQLSRNQKFERLTKMGFEKEKKWLEKLHITSRLTRQPFCLFGLCTYFFTSPLRKLPFIKPFGLPLEQAKTLWDELWPEVRKTLLERFPNRNGSANVVSQWDKL